MLIIIDKVAVLLITPQRDSPVLHVRPSAARVAIRASAEGQAVSNMGKYYLLFDSRRGSGSPVMKAINLI